MQAIFDIYRTMLAESAVFHAKNDEQQMAAALKMSQGRLRDILRLRQETEPVLAFVGLTNAGKSTLLSALFGAKVAPTSNRPWSSVPVEYRFSNNYEVSAEFTDTIDTSSEIFDSTEQMLDFIEKYATATGSEEARILYAKMPSELLCDGLVIADTPGFGAAFSAGGDTHGKVLLDYLPQVDYIFWVIKSLQGITKVELDFYEKFLDDKCHDIVVNCFDDYSDEEKRDFVKTNSRPLGGRFNWHFVNAKTALKAKNAGNKSLLQSSGIVEFEEKIASLGPTKKRLTYLDQSLTKLFIDISHYKKTCKSRMFFVEHRRLQLAHMLRDCNDDTELVRAIKQSIL